MVMLGLLRKAPLAAGTTSGVVYARPELVKSPVTITLNGDDVAAAGAEVPDDAVVAEFVVVALEELLPDEPHAASKPATVTAASAAKPSLDRFISTPRNPDGGSLLHHDMPES
jgi:hypothetical protein